MGKMRHATTLHAMLILLTSATSTAQGVRNPLPAPRHPPDTPASRFADDTRLDQKVSVTAWSEPLEELLERLGRETGVLLACEGREVADQRVHVVLREQTLRRVKALIGETLDLYWRRERKAPGWRYVLFRDVRGRKEEAALVRRAGERYVEGLKRLVDSLRMTEAEVGAIRAKSPIWGWWLREPQRRMAVGFLEWLSPAQWETLLQTGKLEFSFSSLPAGQQQRVLRYVEEANKARDARDEREGTPGRRRIGDVTRPGGKVVFTVYGGVPPGPESSLDFGIEPEWGGRHGGDGLYLAYTNDEMRKIEAEDVPARFRRRTARTSPEEAVRVTIAWKEKPQRWEQVLRAVSAGAELQVVSDSFLFYPWERNMELPDGAALRDQPLAEALDRVTRPFSYVWRREGDVYQFRHRYWYLEKRHNVPERDLRRWRKHLAEGGRLELEDLAELSLLSHRQLRDVEGTGIETDVARGQPALLRFYASLSAEQRVQLAERGLRFRALTPAQAERLAAWRPSAGGGADARLSLRHEADAVVFRLDADASTPREERIKLGRKGPRTRI